MKKLLCGMMCSVLLLSPALAADAPASSGLLISPGPAASTAPAYTVIVDGAVLDLADKTTYETAGKIMVPLRAVAEALGYTVTWTAEKPDAVEIDNGSVRTWIYLGVDSYSRTSSTALGMGAPESFGAAPVAMDNTTYVPMDVFTLLGDTATVDGSAIVFTAANGGGGTELPNPLKEYESVEAAREAVGFSFGLPTVPEGYVLSGVSVISGEVAQVIYENGGTRITYRAAAGSADISGDYNVYTEQDTLEAGGLTVTVKGNGGTVSLATWQNGGKSYSLHLDQGMTREAVAELIGG